MNYQIAKETKKKVPPPHLKPFQAYQRSWLGNKSSSVFRLQAFFIGRGGKREVVQILVVVLYTMATSRFSAGKAIVSGVVMVKHRTRHDYAAVTVMHVQAQDERGKLGDRTSVVSHGEHWL